MIGLLWLVKDVRDMSYSTLCIGGYSCLLCSFNMGVSFVIGYVFEYVQKYIKNVLKQNCICQ